MEPMRAARPSPALARTALRSGVTVSNAGNARCTPVLGLKWLNFEEAAWWCQPDFELDLPVTATCWVIWVSHLT